MMSKKNKRKPRRARDLITLGMILTRKGGKMKDKRDKRRQNKEHQELRDAV